MPSASAHPDRSADAAGSRHHCRGPRRRIERHHRSAAGDRRADGQESSLAHLRQGRRVVASRARGFRNPPQPDGPDSRRLFSLVRSSRIRPVRIHQRTRYVQSISAPRLVAHTRVDLRIRSFESEASMQRRQFLQIAAAAGAATLAPWRRAWAFYQSPGTPIPGMSWPGIAKYATPLRGVGPGGIPVALSDGVAATGATHYTLKIAEFTDRL